VLVSTTSSPLPSTAQAGQPSLGSPGTFTKVISGMLTLCGLIAMTYVVPPLHWARPWTPADPAPFWNLIGRELLGDGGASNDATERIEAVEALARTIDTVDVAPIEDRPIVTAAVAGQLPPYAPHPDDTEAVPRSLDLPRGDTLDPFYAQLARTEAGLAGEITRVTHWGDSAIANDNVTSTLREIMQRRFGDAGHGFHLLTKPDTSYRHRGVEFSDGESWSHCYIINDCKRDGLYGLGGTTVWSAGGASSRFATAKSAPNGRKLSRFEVWYVAAPGGGDIRLTVDRDEPVYIDTEAEAVEDRWFTLTLPDGPHSIQVRANAGGRVRLHGVVLERDAPGVVWDGMAQLGAFSSRMLNFDPDHLRRQIAHRDPALLVFEFGGNDLILKDASLKRYEDQFRSVLRHFRGEGNRPCLVVAPADHGERKGQRIVSVDAMGTVTLAQRAAALAEGCAFFDTWAAMGGPNAIASWRKSKLMSGDLSHLTDTGQRVMGRMIYLALMEGYREYRLRTDGSSRAG